MKRIAKNIKNMAVVVAALMAVVCLVACTGGSGVTAARTTFSADGGVSGLRQGTYTIDDTHITIELDGVTYSGVCAVGYDADQDAFVSTFTAMSEDGQTLWGIRATGQE